MTSVAETISGVRAIQQGRRGGYENLVADLVDNRSFEPEEIIEALDAAGKSADDLENDVEKLSRRRQLVRLVAEAPDFDHQIRAIRSERDRLDRELNAAAAIHKQQIHALQQREAALQSQLQQLESARRELRRTTSTEHRARAAALDAALAEADGRRKVAIAELKLAREIVGEHEALAAAATDKKVAETHLQDAKNNARRVEKAAKALEPIAAEVQELEKRRAELHAEALRTA